MLGVYTLLEGYISLGECILRCISILLYHIIRVYRVVSSDVQIQLTHKYDSRHELHPAPWLLRRSRELQSPLRGQARPLGSSLVLPYCTTLTSRSNMRICLLWPHTPHAVHGTCVDRSQVSSSMCRTAYSTSTSTEALVARQPTHPQGICSNHGSCYHGRFRTSRLPLVCKVGDGVQRGRG